MHYFYHGLLAVSFLPGRCPLCIPELRGWSFTALARFACCTELSFIVLRHDSLLSSSDFYIFDPAMDDSLSGPVCVIASPPCWSELSSNLRLSSSAPLQTGCRIFKPPNGYDIEHCIASTLRVATAAPPDHVRRAPFLHPSPVQLAVFYGSG